MTLDRLIELLISATPPTLMAAAVYYKGSELHKLVNSRMTELLELAKKESAAQATLDEKNAEHTRKGEAAVAQVKQQAVDAATQVNEETQLITKE